MKINKNKSAIFVYSLFFAFIFVYGAYAVIFQKASGNGVFDVPASAVNFYETGGNDNTVNLTPAVESKENIADVASKGTVNGKVIEKYISPYTANTSYKNVYLKNNTDLNIDIKSLLKEKLSFNIEKNASPQVLIFHTHATESFLMSSRDYYTDKDLTRRTDNALNMVALGKIVTDRLNGAGVLTLHDKTQHDYPSYNEAYSRAAKTICSYKNKYPSIKVIIDIHRDSVSAGENDKVKLTKDINGKPAAQIMLVMGSQSGNVKNFPDYKENLKLAVRIQQKTETMYPGLARSISLMSKNYNESLSKGSVLIEIGTDANSLEEVKYSAELLGNVLAELFSEL